MQCTGKIRNQLHIILVVRSSCYNVELNLLNTTDHCFGIFAYEHPLASLYVV